MPPQLPGDSQQPMSGSPSPHPQGQPQFGATSAGGSPNWAPSPYSGQQSPYAASANTTGTYGDGQFQPLGGPGGPQEPPDRKSTRLNSSHVKISYAVFCLKKKNKKTDYIQQTNDDTHITHN